jgi:hypothetical protein
VTFALGLKKQSFSKTAQMCHPRDVTPSLIAHRVFTATDALPAGWDFLLRIPTGRLADCNEII